MKLRQLTLRELFLLVVIAAMGCGWWFDRRQMESDCFNAINAVMETRETERVQSRQLRDAYEKKAGRDRKRISELEELLSNN